MKTGKLRTGLGALLMWAGVTQPSISGDVRDIGERIYKDNCAGCHDIPGSGAPALSTLKSLRPPVLGFALTKGKMATQGRALKGYDMNFLIGWLTREQKPLTEWRSKVMCEDRTVDTSGERYLTKWGVTDSFNRYQEKTSLNAENISKLKLKWAFVVPGASGMRSQPAVVGDTLFFGVADERALFALDRETACVKWVYDGPVPMRSATSFGTLPDGRNIVYIGDARGTVHMVEAATGKLIWKKNISTHDTAGLTGTATLVDNVLYVPQSMGEIAVAGTPSYECCSAHGVIVALNATTGEKLWTYHTMEPAQKTGTSSVGTQLWGPSGAPVWTSPLVDKKRGLLYFGTGENTSHPATGTSDAIIALDMKTGEQVWVFQATADDVFNNACFEWIGRENRPNCPENAGPDFDFGASTLLATGADGRELLLAGQKSGIVWALEPETGKLVWKRTLSDGTPLGGIHWGISAQNGMVFAPVNDPDIPIALWQYKRKPGVYALDVATGTVQWKFEKSYESRPATAEHYAKYGGFSGAAFGVPGVVLAGDIVGEVFALNADDGDLLWSYETNKDFTSPHGLKGHGGSIDNAMIVAAGDTLYIQSGYSMHNQLPGNVLLAFEVQE